MFNIDFYRDSRGYCSIESFLDSLQEKAERDKNSRIQWKQLTQYIQLLSDHGTQLGPNITKRLVENIWELRPGDNRILFFFFCNNTFVLLHQFRKKTQKTPSREIERAKKERDDWISRKGRFYG